MLVTLLELYDHHPSEDTTTTALLVQGVLKAAAVLKVVRLKYFPLLMYSSFSECASVSNATVQLLV